jgi:trehalose 6-phosphate synthase
VLILSRFAGAAHELEQAILVNPYDTEGTAAAIAQALNMSLPERRERWAAMMTRLQANGVDDWCRNFLSALAGDLLAEAPAVADPVEPGRRRPSSRVRTATVPG